MPTETTLRQKIRTKRSQNENANTGKIPTPGIRRDADSAPDADSEKSPFTVFRTLFESGKNNDFDAMAETIADDCEWVVMSNMKSFKGKKDVVALCEAGKLASDKTPEIILDNATAEWGVFEYMNRGVITESLSRFAASSGWQSPVDPSTLVGRKYEVPVCFVYHLNAQGKICLLHEYLDLGSLMEQFK
jgi:ketosteroid isomerase-like protein